jgi:hypothetical protein
VIDAASVDGRRRLVLIRRDNVEHLMMIGGPNDLVVEPNIVRATAARDTGRDQFRPAPPEARQETRSTPVVETNGGSWPLQPSVEPPVPAAPQPRVVRDFRTSVTDEPWVEPPREPAPRPRSSDLSGSISGMAADFNARLNPDLESPPAPPRQSPPQAAPQATPQVTPPAAVAPPPAAPPLPPQTDRNLAEMAQRLEAALRRPNTRDDNHPPATDPLAAPLPPKAGAPRVEPHLDFKPEPRPEPKIESEAQAKNPFDSLEEEMASLLGRQPGKT